MFSIKYWAALALSVAVATASPTPNTIRSSSSESSLYAYGSKASGLPLWYGNGMAYLGHHHPANITNSANVTLSMSGSSLTAQAVANTSTDPSIGSPKLYIDSTSGSFAQVGFTNDSTTSESITTTGFTFLGTMLMWENDDGDLESSWYAEPLDQEGSVWKLLWNTDVDITSDSSVETVVLKNKAPTSD